MSLLGNIATFAGRNLEQYTMAKQQQSFAEKASQDQRAWQEKLEEQRTQRAFELAQTERGWKQEDALTERGWKQEDALATATAAQQAATAKEQRERSQNREKNILDNVNTLDTRIDKVRDNYVKLVSSDSYDPETTQDLRALLDSDVKALEDEALNFYNEVPDDVLDQLGLLPRKNAAIRRITELREIQAKMEADAAAAAEEAAAKQRAKDEAAQKKLDAKTPPVNPLLDSVFSEAAGGKQSQQQEREQRVQKAQQNKRYYDQYVSRLRELGPTAVEDLQKAIDSGSIPEDQLEGAQRALAWGRRMFTTSPTGSTGSRPTTSGRPAF